MPPGFDPLVYRDPRPSRAFIRALEPVARLVLRHVLRVRSVELPAADRARLAAAVSPDTAAFLAPLHPEFLTDWMIDKEIAARVSPLMAHWASYEIVNVHPVAQRLWLAANLIANVPGGGGREYSLSWALAGHGVLLHPEGTATWHGRHVGELLPGAVRMALECACRARGAASRPVFTVPLVWALAFERDARAPLLGAIAGIESGLGLPASSGSLAERFAALQRAVLIARHERFGLPAPAGDAIRYGRGFFAAQNRMHDVLLARAEAVAGSADSGGDLRRRLHAARRALRARSDLDAARAREARAMLREAERLAAFSAERYGRETLTQEEIAESLQRLRIWLLTRTAADRWHAFVPRAVATRRAHIRVPAPLAIECRDGSLDEAASRLTIEMRSSMQRALDALWQELEPAVGARREPNPFATAAE